MHKKFQVERLKPFWGSKEKTGDLSARNYDQFVVLEVRHYRGNLAVRKTMEFFVVFVDRDELWITWSHDLDCLVPYEDFIHSRPELKSLTMKALVARKELARLRGQEVTAVVPGDTFYLDMRWYNFGWYDGWTSTASDTSWNANTSSSLPRHVHLAAACDSGLYSPKRNRGQINSLSRFGAASWSYSRAIP